MFKCTSINSRNFISYAIWFFINSVFHPAIFFLSILFFRTWILYQKPGSDHIDLKIISFIILTLSIKTACYAITTSFAYLAGNNPCSFLKAQLLPQSKWSWIGQTTLIFIGFLNFMLYAVRGIEATIVGLSFFVLLAFTTFIAACMTSYTLYRIIKRSYQ